MTEFEIFAYSKPWYRNEKPKVIFKYRNAMLKTIDNLQNSLSYAEIKKSSWKKQCAYVAPVRSALNPSLRIQYNDEGIIFEQKSRT
uniref:Uncharacterized protein n=1 Tax=Romanomermis culicivorax TaxID=13658 RepID=A0A915JYU0_ROMCU